MRKTILLFLLLLGGISYSQQNKDRRIVYGKIVSNSQYLEGVYVANLNTGDAISTSKGGYFEINSGLNDTLVFSGALFVGYRHTLDELDLERDLLLIPLDRNDLNQYLDDILITRMASQSMGFAEKTYTPVERKLYTATSGGYIFGVDYLVNLMNGKIRMLKKALVYEKMESTRYVYLKEFSEDKIRELYNIPDKYIKAFTYYVVYDDQMKSLLSSQRAINKILIKERSGVLAAKFLELLTQAAKEVDKETQNNSDKNQKSSSLINIKK